MLRPGLKVFGFDWRLAQVIEHKRLVRKLAGQFDSSRELVRIYKDVVSKSEFTQVLNSSQEGLAQHKAVIRLSLDDVPEAAQLVIV